jgi:hypothetical protein
MTARKLSRLAGFALMLAAVFGGVGAASATAVSAAPVVSSVDTATQLNGDIVWG